MESDQTKRLKDVNIPDVTSMRYAIHEELIVLSRRLDALEAAHNTLAADVEDMKPHDASGYTLPKDQPATVGERIAMKCAFWEKRRECAEAIDGFIEVAVRNPRWSMYSDTWEKRAEKAEAEVKRLSDPGWIERVPISMYHGTTHLSSIREAFARHVKGGGA